MHVIGVLVYTPLHLCCASVFSIGGSKGLWFVMQAPIKVFGVEGRYAHALFSAATQKNAIDKVEKELTDFQVSLLIYFL